MPKSESNSLKVRLAKIINHYWSAHDHCVCCCLRRKSVELQGIVEFLLSWREQNYLTATGKPTKIATIEIFNKTHALRFFKNQKFFFLPVFKKKANTLHLYRMCGAMKTLKHSVSTTLQLAYHAHDCKNLTHTSQIGLCHFKLTQMVVTVRFTILKI